MGDFLRMPPWPGLFWGPESHPVTQRGASEELRLDPDGQAGQRQSEGATQTPWGGGGGRPVCAEHGEAVSEIPSVTF